MYCYQMHLGANVLYIKWKETKSKSEILFLTMETECKVPKKYLLEKYDGKHFER